MEYGSPRLDPIWIDLVDASTVIMATGRTSLKTQNILRGPRVAISIVDMDNPYEEAQLRGVCEVQPDLDRRMADGDMPDEEWVLIADLRDQIVIEGFI
ncbi:pyridoxamine 5'-phosphate oxidase family protein [Candidatus Poriferisodalis sp.]|uniref:pyridoxamine 5'-phosphate oxidase family protein n=1 Tax=Candidatus Poriferisodalis sp. TaxID=3101277 RepID=UPI003B012F52